MPNLLNLKPQYKYRLLAGIVPAVLLLSSFLMLNLSSSKIALRKRNLDEAVLKNQTYEEARSLNQFVISNITSLEKMSTAIPSESMMVGVIQDIEAVIGQYDPNGTVKISSQNPVRSGQDLVIPLTITLKTSPLQLTQFIEDIKDLPYLIQVLAVDSQIAGDNSQSIINLRMYVQDPFIGF